jgi:hypothetical protein
MECNDFFLGGALKRCKERQKKVSQPVKIAVSQTKIETGGSDGV